MNRPITLSTESLEATLRILERIRVLLDRLGSREGAGDETSEALALRMYKVAASEHWYEQTTIASRLLWDAASNALSKNEVEALIDSVNESEEAARRISGI